MQTSALPKNNTQQILALHGEPLNYLKGDHYFCFAQKHYNDPETPDKYAWIQDFHHVSEYADVLANADTTLDTFVSVALFSGTNGRKTDDVEAVACLFADLDIEDKLDIKLDENPAGFKNALKKALRRLRRFGVPMPSCIVFSGKGYHLKWYFSEATDNFKKWHVVERLIVKALQGYGVDTKVCDLARVLRVENTDNYDAKKLCQVVRRGKTFSSFEEVAAQILKAKGQIDPENEIVKPYSEQKKAKPTHTPAANEKGGKKGKSGLRIVRKRMTLEYWKWYHVLSDIEKLSNLRYGGEEHAAHDRDPYIFISAIALGHMYPNDEQKMRDKLEAIREVVAPSWSDKKFGDHMYSVWQRYAEDKTAREEGREDEAIRLYTYDTDRIIKFLDVKDHEMPYMRVLLTVKAKASKKTAANRDKCEKRRRKAGAETRDAYLSAAEKKRRKAVFLSRNGYSAADIVEELKKDGFDVSLRTVQAYISVSKKGAKSDPASSERRREGIESLRERETSDCVVVVGRDVEEVSNVEVVMEAQTEQPKGKALFDKWAQEKFGIDAEVIKRQVAEDKRQRDERRESQLKPADAEFMSKTRRRFAELQDFDPSKPLAFAVAAVMPDKMKEPLQDPADFVYPYPRREELEAFEAEGKQERLEEAADALDDLLNFGYEAEAPLVAEIKPANAGSALDELCEFFEQAGQEYRAAHVSFSDEEISVAQKQAAKNLATLDFSSYADLF